MFLLHTIPTCYCHRDEQHNPVKPATQTTSSSSISHFFTLFHTWSQVEEEEYQIKPMNCPFHVGIYKQGYHSYRDLPIRMAELGTVYRYERSGTMHGLFRVRGFTQDDAHIFCLPTQVWVT